jgi:hypothetical protein
LKGFTNRVGEKRDKAEICTYLNEEMTRHLQVVKEACEKAEGAVMLPEQGLAEMTRSMIQTD